MSAGEKLDIDLTWANPSKAQMAALDIAMRQKTKGLTEFQVAEFIMLAQESLWFVQAQHWAERPPDNVPPSWRRACLWIVEVVKTGYDSERGTWWKLSGTKTELVAKLLLLMDFGMMLKQYKRQSMDMVSGGFQVFIDLVCGQGWERKFQVTMKKLEALKALKGIEHA